MKALIKIGLLTASLTAFAGLTACQSTSATQEQPNRPMMHKDGHKSGHMKRHQRNLIPEQRAEWDKRRTERQMRHQQIQQACAGKTAGQAIQIKMNDKTLEGTCEMRFMPKRPVRPANLATQPAAASQTAVQPAV